tara:strand:- start:454 stop:774 length:321 start_codon:yes stop_codon:yes gene_type:complete
LLEGAAGVIERGGRKAHEVAEEQIKDLHAKIEELTVFNEEIHKYGLPEIIIPIRAASSRRLCRQTGCAIKICASRWIATAGSSTNTFVEEINVRQILSYNLRVAHR